MEDLIPLLIFIVIAIVNVLKQINDKRNRQAAEPPEEESAGTVKETNTLEGFFDDLARKFGPQQQDLPEWPENVERPDYLREMQEYEAGQSDPIQEELPAAPVPPVPEVILPEAVVVPARKAVVRPRGMAKTPTFKLKAQDTALAGLSGAHLPVPPLLRSATGRTRFEINTRRKLKKALIASMVFGPPRAYEQSFHNTMAE